VNHPLFTPTDVPGRRLDEITVGREDILDRLTSRIKDIATTGARPHTLIVGPRGSGKTHLLTLVLYRSSLDTDVANHVTTVHIAEDAIGISSYPDLLVELVRVVSPADTQHALALRRSKRTVDLEHLLLSSAHGRPLVLVLENLDRIFQSIGESGQRGLRGLVETSAQIALLASTPVLSHPLATRAAPWFGSFDVEHLADLSLADGTHLLRQLAVERGDDELAAFLDQQPGQDRLAALAHLAGGSPRLWHILSGCLTVETLDELIPAVRALLEQLTPYYQQRLWELPATEQQLVVTLARADGAVTVTTLAEEAGVERSTATTTLIRLADTGWVRGSKWPGTDQRTTWYELREPLLRHHLQYRNSRGGTLDLIVTILRAWYTTAERTNMLSAPTLGLRAATYLAQSILNEAPYLSLANYSDQDVSGLIAGVRMWKYRRDDERAGSPALAEAIEEVCRSAELGLSHQKRDDVLRVGQDTQEAAKRVGAALHRLQRLTWSIDERSVLSLIEIRWNYAADPVRARRELANQLNLRNDQTDRLTLQIAHELADFTGLSGRHAEACELLASLIEKQAKLGVDHPDTLTSRQSLAHWRGMAGDPADAVVALVAVVTDRSRVLGVDHPDTLTSRQSLAHWRGMAGDSAGAAAAQDAVVRDMTRVLGADHPDTLRARNKRAHWLGVAGDPAGAVAAQKAVVRDMKRVLGAKNLDTLRARHVLAAWWGMAGDPAGAAAAQEAVVRDMTRVLGADHLDALRARDVLAHWRGVLGDTAGAVALSRAVVADRTRVLGAHHSDTLFARYILGYWRWEAGDQAGTAAAMEAVLDDMSKVWGPDHPRTLEAASILPYLRGEGARDRRLRLGEPRGAGPDDADTPPHTQNYTDSLADGEFGGSMDAVLEKARVLRPERVSVLVEQLSQDEKEPAATAIIANIRLGTKWRTKVLEAAGLPEDALGWRIHRALDRDGPALAGLPEEIRSLVTAELAGRPSASS